MPTVRELITRWVSTFDKKGLTDWNKTVDKGKEKADSAEKSVKKLTDAFGKLGITIGAAVLINSIRNRVTEFISMADHLDKMSAQLGVTTDELQAFTFAAGLSGAGPEILEGALAKLQLRMREASTGSAEARKIFQDLGVEVRDQQGNLRPVTDLFMDIADRVASIENPAQRTALVMKAFEESGRALIPMLQGGSAGIRGMLAEVRTLGGGVSRDAIARSVELTDSMSRLQLAGTSLSSTIMVALLPRINDLVTGMTRAVVWIRDVTENSHILQATAITVGAALAAVGVLTAASWGPAALTVGLTTAAILLAALAIDDLWVTMEGGTSVTSKFIDSQLGVGATTQIIENARQAWEDLAWAIGLAWSALQPFIEWLGGIEGISAGIVRAILPFISAIESLVAMYNAIRGATGFQVYTATEETRSPREIERQRRIEETRQRAIVGRQQRRERVAREERAREEELFQVGAALVGSPLTTVAHPELLPGPRRRGGRREISRRGMIEAPMIMAPTVAGPTQANIQSSTTVGQIVVHGTSDPEATAREVRRQVEQLVEEHSARDRRMVEEALVPEAAR